MTTTQAEIQADIERGKTLFLPDYKRLEESLEKSLKDPGLSFPQRTEIMNKLTSLKVRWQESGIGDISVVEAIVDNLKAILAEGRRMNLQDGDFEVIFSEYLQSLAELEKILKQAKGRGLA